LGHGRYINSVWCRINEKSIAACDAYEITRRELISATMKEMDFNYYLKFAVNNQGKLLLMCHAIFQIRRCNMRKQPMLCDLCGEGTLEENRVQMKLNTNRPQKFDS